MTRQQSIAFLGTGLMGAPMARRLARAGHPVTVWNRDETKARPLEAEGARVAATAAEAVRGSDIVFTMLSHGNAVREVLFDHGCTDAMQAGAVVIDTSSIAPPMAREHARLLGLEGIAHLDAPVSGGVVGAEAGTLAIMAGGEAAVLEAVRGILEVLGRVNHVGPDGAGQVCKLANQQIVAVTIGALAEAMILVEAGGASRQAFRDAIRGGFAESRILDLHGARMIARDFSPGGTSRNQLKDLDAVLSLAAALSLSLPLTEQVQRAFADFVRDGGAEQDHSGLLLHLEHLNPSR